MNPSPGVWMGENINASMHHASMHQCIMHHASLHHASLHHASCINASCRQKTATPSNLIWVQVIGKSSLRFPPAKTFFLSLADVRRIHDVKVGARRNFAKEKKHMTASLLYWSNYTWVGSKIHRDKIQQYGQFLVSFSVLIIIIRLSIGSSFVNQSKSNVPADQPLEPFSQMVDALSSLKISPS